MIRIGVISDTHVGEAIPVLPESVFERLAGVDLVLHAGDLTELSVLRHLEERIAPVVAVRGDHDAEAGIDLPEVMVVNAGGHRIGLVHGDRGRAVEYPAAALTLLRHRPTLLGFHRNLRRRVRRDVDCIVYGHLHLPFIGRMDGVDFFSPGAVYVPEREPGYYRAFVRGRAYLRFRRELPEPAREPSVGIIEAGPELTYRIVPLG